MVYHRKMEHYCKRDFAPEEGLIKEIQKPFRDEIYLKVYWQFMIEEKLKDMLKKLEFNDFTFYI